MDSATASRSGRAPWRWSRPRPGFGSPRHPPRPSRARGTIPRTCRGARPWIFAAGSRPQLRSARRAAPAAPSGRSPETSARSRDAPAEPQQILGGLVLAQTLQGTSRYSEVVPVPRQERFKHIPILLQARTVLWLIHTSIIRDSRNITKRLWGSGRTTTTPSYQRLITLATSSRAAVRTGRSAANLDSILTLSDRRADKRSGPMHARMNRRDPLREDPGCMR